MHVPTLHFVASIWMADERLGSMVVWQTHGVIAFSSPNCKSEFTRPLCVIVDLTCRMRGDPDYLPKQQHKQTPDPGRPDVELQTSLPSSHSNWADTEGPSRCLRWKGLTASTAPGWLGGGVARPCSSGLHGTAMPIFRRWVGAGFASRAAIFSSLGFSKVLWIV